MTSPTKEHRFTLSDYDYLVDAVSTQPPSGAMSPTSPGATSPRSATSPTSFRALPNIPRVTSPGAAPGMENILGPGPAPIPASPEQPPSRASSSSPPAGVGLTYPPRTYPGQFMRPTHGPTSPSNGGPSRPPFGSVGSNGSLDYNQSYQPSRQPSSATSYAPSRQPSSASFATAQAGPSRQPSSRHPMEPHPMEPRIPEPGLSPLPPDGRLSIVSEPADEKDGEKTVAPTLSSYAPPKPANKWLDGFWPKNLAIRLLIVVTFLEAVIDIAIQANLLWRYDQEISDDSTWADGRRLRIFLVVFIIAHVIQMTLTLWAVYYRNTIQIVGLAIFNCLLLIYAAIQVGEIAEVLGTNTDGNAHTDNKIFSLPIKILSGLVIGVIAAAQIAIVILTWFIWKEFGWRIYRFLGADLQIRRYYRQYQIFESILCFTFFFFVGFSFIFMVLRADDPEKYITIIMLPLSLVWLALGAIAGRWELAWLMATFLVGMHGAMAYFIFKMVRIWTQPHVYEGVEKSLTIFSVLALAMIVLCVAFGIVVWRNFGKGLKRATGWRRKGKGHRHTPSDELGLGQAAEGQNFKLQHRLTID